jgi:hypothetical protein
MLTEQPSPFIGIRMRDCPEAVRGSVGRVPLAVDAREECR